VPGVARRAAAIEPFEVMDVLRAARELEAATGDVPGLPVCHLEVGQPSTPPPAAVLDAARAALDGPLGYSDSLGLDALRRRISRWYANRDATEVAPDRIAVTSGASAGCVLAFLAAFDPGDRVAVVEPGYPCYRHMLAAFGVDAVAVPVGPEQGFRPTPELLDAVLDGGPLRGLVVATPSNPTGSVLDADELDAVLGWCRRHDVRPVVDEIYHDLVEAPRPPTAASDPSAVVVQSCSKYFCMTGWRLGWLVLPEELVRPVERLAQNLYLSPPTLSQHAALAAFDATDELDANVARYTANRHVLVDALRAAGLDRIAPATGAFYVWVDVGELLERVGGDSRSLCRRWLEDLAVAATPGVDFDAARGDRFVRLSVAGSTDEVAEAARRLSRWVDAR
jgi:aspartate/methionine/tyrosine aminotransferase